MHKRQTPCLPRVLWLTIGREGEGRGILRDRSLLIVDFFFQPAFLSLRHDPCQSGLASNERTSRCESLQVEGQVIKFELDDHTSMYLTLGPQPQPQATAAAEVDPLQPSVIYKCVRVTALYTSVE